MKTTYVFQKNPFSGKILQIYGFFQSLISTENVGPMHRQRTFAPDNGLTEDGLLQWTVRAYSWTTAANPGTVCVCPPTVAACPRTVHACPPTIRFLRARAFIYRRRYFRTEFTYLYCENAGTNRT